jgi:hypothetical protein
MRNTACTKTATTVPPPTRDRLRKLIGAIGETEAIAELGVSRQTLSRALAGLGVRRGTVALIEQQLSAFVETAP